MPREKVVHKGEYVTEDLGDDLWIQYIIWGGILGNMTTVSS